MNDRLIFKIVTRTEWEEAKTEGTFRGSEVDFADGYIHFSSRNQLQETAEKHFAGQEDLLLVAVSEDKLGDSIRWEESRGGQLFPHLYSDLMVSQVDEVWNFPLDHEGQRVYPF